MHTNPILEEIWRVKDQLAAEAGYDVDRFFENLREWSAKHPRSGPVVRNAEDLRQLVAEEERKRAESSPLAVKEEPPGQQRCEAPQA